MAVYRRGLPAAQGTAPTQPMRPSDVSLSLFHLLPRRSGLAGRWWLAVAAVAVWWLSAITGAPATAQDFDPSALASDDQAMIQNALEFDRTDTPRQLPSSRATFVITRTIGLPSAAAD